METQERYIPAASYDRLTPLYDPVLRYVLRQAAWKQALVAQTGVRDGMAALDVGCGTGTLAAMLKAAATDSLVVGLDGDARVLVLAKRKTARRAANIALVRGLAVPLPFGDATFDRVTVSLVLHHLRFVSKRRALADIFRVLRPGGELHIADFGAPHTRVAAEIGRLVKRFEEAGDNIGGWLPILCRTAGFVDVAVTKQYMTIAGTIALVSGRRAPS